MAKVKWSQESFDWLKQIRDYIAQDRPEVSQNIARGIVKKIDLLKDFPEIGYRLNTTQKDLRVTLYGHYRIVYKLNENKDVSIVGIFHGALDLKKHLDL